MNARWKTLTITFSCVLLFATLAEACPTCKDGLGNDPARADMVRGYFWSILFMMSMPFLILAGLGTYFYLQIRKARRAGWGTEGTPFMAQDNSPTFAEGQASADSAWDAHEQPLEV